MSPKHILDITRTTLKTITYFSYKLHHIFHRNRYTCFLKAFQTILLYCSVNSADCSANVFYSSVKRSIRNPLLLSEDYENVNNSLWITKYL